MSDELGELRTVVDDSCAAVSADEAIERSRGRAPSAGFHRPARSRPHLMVVGAAAAFVVIGGLIWQQSVRSTPSTVRAVPDRTTSTTLAPSPTEASDCPADMPEEFRTTSSLPPGSEIYFTARNCGHMTSVVASDFERTGWVSIDEIAAMGLDQKIPVYDDRGNQIAWWASDGLGWIELDEAAAPGWDVRSARRAEEDEMIRRQVERGNRIGMPPTNPPSGLWAEEFDDLAAEPHRRFERLVFVSAEHNMPSSGVPARLELTFVVDERAEETLARIAEQRGVTVTEVDGRPFVIYDDGGERVAVWARAGVLLVTSRSVGVDDLTISSLVDTVQFF